MCEKSYTWLSVMKKRMNILQKKKKTKKEKKRKKKKKERRGERESVREREREREKERERESEPESEKENGAICCLLVVQQASNKLVYLRDGENR